VCHALRLGGTVLARTVNYQNLATAIREAARDAALKIGGFERVRGAGRQKQKARVS
jgi:hypothetical protein